MKPEGSTETSKLVRQERVYRLVIRGLKPIEIARQENVDERTIQRDVKEIKFALLQIIQTQQLRTHKLALAELDEIWRELWALYHRVPRETLVKHGNEMRMTKEDDRPIKVMILEHLAKVSDLKNRLVFQIPVTPVTQNMSTGTMQSSELVVVDFINTLPEPLRSSVRETLERQTGISEENT